ncbi:bifunctional lysylphosphatidylglycerol flippase/synthetase MprF [Streptomyces sp. NP160]|uniref:bifunctional lysylphosphatidylglycerol flippase/synthetase MprF n=1 Tax=Streptomyces sp. NP160 TaxID=2586637 RepID=UPI0015D5EF20|nr:bifunctional lysylphosphatidylglycerol flippase/synthetase MprF [Streptomyces sp. NP160]
MSHACDAASPADTDPPTPPGDAAPVAGRRTLPSWAGGRRLGQLAVLVFLAAAVLVLQERLGDHPWHRLGDDLAALGARPVVLALAATAASYGLMVAYDALALAYVEHRTPLRRYAAASFVATALGNSLGASALVGAALRARAYSAWGLPAFAITRLTAFNLVTLSLGSALLVAAGLVWGPAAVVGSLPLGGPARLVLAGLLVGSVAAYLLWCGRGAPLVVRDWRIDRPSRRTALTQLTLSVSEWLVMAAVLYVLLPPGHDLGFPAFAAVFVLATTLGLLSNVPGGLGVVEAVLVLALAGSVPAQSLVTALVAYRLVYFLVPLALATVVLAGLEARRRPDRGAGLVRVAGVLTPSALALVVAVLGGVLVATGQAPAGDAAHGVLGGLGALGPFATSLAGVGLLVLARGLHRRLRGAWALALAVLVVVCATHPTLLGAGAAALAVLLVVARGTFHRRTGRRAWSLPLAVAAAALLLWWHAAQLAPLWGDRPVLSAVAGGPHWPTSAALALAVVVLVGAGLALQRPAAHRSTASHEELRRAATVLASTTPGNASLLWTGDKQVHFSRGGGAFLMYRVEGRSWVVMGDPLGDEREFDDLLRSFLELCASRCGRPALYCVRRDLVDLYREHGLSTVKLGEEAVVPLVGFSMEGRRRAKLRAEHRASVRAGVEVEVVTGERLQEAMPELREVSDEWLVERGTQEKSFSLGRFEEDYVSRFPVVVARAGGRVVAFASLWVGGSGHEVHVDLMRRRTDAPRTVMTHLFVEAMLWAQERGCTSFSLGMAPLSGLDVDGNGTFWHRIGHLVWTHGEHFYGFRGLRQFKERFDPTWEPRYVASAGGPSLPVVVFDVAKLVGGGVRGMVPQLHAAPWPSRRKSPVPVGTATVPLPRSEADRVTSASLSG